MQYDVPWQRHTGHKGKGETGCSLMFCGRDMLDTEEKLRLIGCSMMFHGRDTLDTKEKVRQDAA